MVKSKIIPIFDVILPLLCDQTLLSPQIQFLVLRLPCQMLDFEIAHFQFHISKYLSIRQTFCKKRERDLVFAPTNIRVFDGSFLRILKHFCKNVWAQRKGWNSILNWYNFVNLNFSFRFELKFAQFFTNVDKSRVVSVQRLQMNFE